MKLKLFTFFLFSLSNAYAQDRQYRFTLSGGASTSVWLTDVKQPGIAGRLWAEKYMDADDARTWWLALEHTYMRAAAPRTELYDPTSTTNTVTKTFHPSTITTLTLGARKWKENNLIYGVGTGLGLYRQGYPFFTYSEELLNYQQYQKAVSGWGIAGAGVLGYKPGNFEININFHSVWDMFRTTNLGDRYDRARNSFVMAVGLSVGYSF